nr:hypothetical protein [Ereboglobus luteus]
MQRVCEPYTLGGLLDEHAAVYKQFGGDVHFSAQQILIGADSLMLAKEAAQARNLQARTVRDLGERGDAFRLSVDDRLAALEAFERASIVRCRVSRGAAPGGQEQSGGLETEEFKKDVAYLGSARAGTPAFADQVLKYAADFALGGERARAIRAQSGTAQTRERGAFRNAKKIFHQRTLRIGAHHAAGCFFANKNVARGNLVRGASAETHPPRALDDKLDHVIGKARAVDQVVGVALLKPAHRDRVAGAPPAGIEKKVTGTRAGDLRGKQLVRGGARSLGDGWHGREQR